MIESSKQKKNSKNITQEKSLEFTINRTLMKLFRTVSSEVINLSVSLLLWYNRYNVVNILLSNVKSNSYVNIVALKMADVNCSQTLLVWNVNCWLGLL